MCVVHGVGDMSSNVANICFHGTHRCTIPRYWIPIFKDIACIETHLHTVLLKTLSTKVEPAHSCLFGT